MKALALAVFTAMTMIDPPAQGQFALTSLTVPAEKLPLGCRLQSPIETRQGPVVNGRTFPVNPWQGNSYRELIELQGAIGGGVQMPDAPPPSRRELAAMQERLLENVVEGYRAEYFNERGVASVVVAVRYKEGAPLPGTTFNRFVFGSTVVAHRVASKNDCATTVESHLRSLK